MTATQPSGNSSGGTTGYGLSTITRTACSGGSCWAADAKYKVRESRSDGSWSESYRDARDREVGRASILNSGSVESRQAFGYNALGQLVTSTVPYRSGETVYTITKTYDLLGRPKSESRRVSEADSSTQSTTWVYNRQSVTLTDAESRVRVFSTDGEGRVESVQEPSPGGTTAYGYSPWGELNLVTDADGHETTSMDYDERGFRTDVVDLDAGSSTYEYTVWGELYRSRDARTGSGYWTLTNIYDELGRLINRVDYDPVVATSATSTWEYYTTTDFGSGAAKGLLYRARSYVGDTSSTLEYEEVNRYDAVAGTQVSPVQTVVKINGAPQATYTTGLDYDAEGRVEHMIYPDTFTTPGPQFDYTYERGYLDTVGQTQSGTYPRYDLVSLDATARPTYVQLGNALLDVKAEYDRVNLLVKTIKSGPPSPGTGAQNLTYTWDKVGNLKSRQDLNQSGTPTYLTEEFTYDALNRLDYVSLNGGTAQNPQYAADGNLTSKTMPDNFQFTYYYATAGKPHAVSKVERGYSSGCSTFYVTDNYAYDEAGNMTSRTGASGNRYVKWTAFSKPWQISLGSSSCSGDCTTFTYGPARQLVKQVDKKGGTTRTIYYVGPHFEVEVSGSSTQYRAHAFANGQVVFTQVEGTSSWESYYPLRDHLGSVDKQYRAAGAGATSLPYSYDSFGRRRNENWTNDGAGTLMVATPWNHQGYTGHEMLDTTQLIHMQGRVYDPTLGRFLSPDPMLDDRYGPQGLNAYSYVGNNPLSMRDPTGLSSVPTPPLVNPGGGDDSGFAGLDYILVIGIKDWPTIDAKFARSMKFNRGATDQVGQFIDAPLASYEMALGAYAQDWLSYANGLRPSVIAPPLGEVAPDKDVSVGVEVVVIAFGGPAQLFGGDSNTWAGRSAFTSFGLGISLSSSGQLSFYRFSTNTFSDEADGSYYLALLTSQATGTIGAPGDSGPFSTRLPYSEANVGLFVAGFGGSASGDDSSLNGSLSLNSRIGPQFGIQNQSSGTINISGVRTPVIP